MWSLLSNVLPPHFPYTRYQTTKKLEQTQGKINTGLTRTGEDPRGLGALPPGKEHISPPRTLALWNEIPAEMIEVGVLFTPSTPCNVSISDDTALFFL